MQTQTTTTVKARIDKDTKKRAAEVLAEMGLSLSEAIRLMMAQVAAERCLPFALKQPNATTRRAMEELEAGGGSEACTVHELMVALHEDD